MKKMLFASLLVAAVATPALADPPPYRLELIEGSSEIYIPRDDFLKQGSRVDSPVHFTLDPNAPPAERLRVYAINSENYFFNAPNFTARAPVQSADPAWLSNFKRPSPAWFDYKGWAQTPYALPDGSYLGVVHNEYHGYEEVPNPGECPTPTQSGITCWYVTGVLVRSTDGAKTWQRTGKLIGIPYKFTYNMVRAGIAGYRIIRHPGDGYLYMLISNVGAYRAQEKGLCLARSISEGQAWQVWQGLRRADGELRFTGTFINPYQVSTDPPADPPEKYTCAPLNAPNLPSTSVSGLFFHEPSGLFFAVGVDVVDPATDLCNRFFFMTSSNLVDWSDPDFFKQACSRKILYPSFVDHTTPPNYDRSPNDDIHLYWAQYDKKGVEPGDFEEPDVGREAYRIVLRNVPPN